MWLEFKSPIDCDTPVFLKSCKVVGIEVINGTTTAIVLEHGERVPVSETIDEAAEKLGITRNGR